MITISSNLIKDMIYRQWKRNYQLNIGIEYGELHNILKYEYSINDVYKPE